MFCEMQAWGQCLYHPGNVITVPQHSLCRGCELQGKAVGGDEGSQVSPVGSALGRMSSLKAKAVFMRVFLVKRHWQ